MTYGGKYRNLLDASKRQLDAAENATVDGDLWQAALFLDKAVEYTTEARDLLHKVSKTAFERVLQEKERG